MGLYGGTDGGSYVGCLSVHIDKCLAILYEGMDGSPRFVSIKHYKTLYICRLMKKRILLCVLLQQIVMISFAQSFSAPMIAEKFLSTSRNDIVSVMQSNGYVSIKTERKSVVEAGGKIMTVISGTYATATCYVYFDMDIMPVALSFSPIEYTSKDNYESVYTNAGYEEISTSIKPEYQNKEKKDREIIRWEKNDNDKVFVCLSELAFVPNYSTRMDLGAYFFSKTFDRTINEGKTETKKEEETQPSDDDDIITQASFPGGDEAFWRWMKKNIKYPKEALEYGIQGRVRVSFVVDKDGSISEIRVEHSAHDLLDAEAVRLIKNMPKWIPAKKNGTPVRERFSVVIPFRLVE